PLARIIIFPQAPAGRPLQLKLRIKLVVGAPWSFRWTDGVGGPPPVSFVRMSKTEVDVRWGDVLEVAAVELEPEIEGSQIPRLGLGRAGEGNLNIQLFEVNISPEVGAPEVAGEVAGPAD